MSRVLTPEFVSSGGEDFHLGSETRLDTWSFLCNKVSLKYNEIGKASDTDIRRGQKECPLAGPRAVRGVLLIEQRAGGSQEELMRRPT